MFDTGNNYIPAYGPLVFIVLGYLCVNLVGLSMKLLYATKYHSSAFHLSGYGAIFTIVICVFLIPPFGALGAAIALGFGKVLRASLFVWKAKRLLGIKTSLLW